jgi:hypothetical protein
MTDTQKPWKEPWFEQLITAYQDDEQSVYHT